jgi:hypothetical protein
MAQGAPAREKMKGSFARRGARGRERRCRASGGRTPCRGEKKSRGSGREEKRERGGEAIEWDRLGVGPAGRERRARAVTGGPALFK